MGPRLLSLHPGDAVGQRREWHLVSLLWLLSLCESHSSVHFFRCFCWRHLFPSIRSCPRIYGHRESMEKREGVATGSPQGHQLLSLHPGYAAGQRSGRQKVMDAE